jgi:uncharacterized membrane protein YphA (DoxX/SURF4 family)
MVRNHLLLCGSDDTLQIAIFLLMLSPSGRALSIDAWRAARRKPAVGPTYTPAWQVRLIQIQLCVIYCTTGLVKVKGTGFMEGTWWEGTSIHYAINYIVMNRNSYAMLPIPYWFTQPLTYVTLVWEVLFPVLVLHRWTRRFALAFGILFHVGIFFTMAIGWFGFYMIDLYGVWTSDAFWDRWRPGESSEQSPPSA